MKADPIPPMRDHNQDDVTGFIRLNALRPAKRDRGQGAEEKTKSRKPANEK
jgi:hypothetical protein